MAWFKKNKAPEPEGQKRSKVAEEGMWLKCNHCREIVYRKEVDAIIRSVQMRVSLSDLRD